MTRDERIAELRDTLFKRVAASTPDPWDVHAIQSGIEELAELALGSAPQNQIHREARDE